MDTKITAALLQFSHLLLAFGAHAAAKVVGELQYREPGAADVLLGLQGEMEAQRVIEAELLDAVNFKLTFLFPSGGESPEYQELVTRRDALEARLQEFGRLGRCYGHLRVICSAVAKKGLVMEEMVANAAKIRDALADLKGLLEPEVAADA